MGYKDISAGDKIGKAVKARFIKSGKGTDAIEVAFEFIEPSTGNKEMLSWQGWLTDKAIDNTMETLKNVLGYNGCADTDSAGVIMGEKSFDYGREVRLVVELEAGQNDASKLYPKIKWVNTLGGSGYAGVAVDTSIKSRVAAAFLAAAKKDGGAVPPPPAQNVQADKVPW